ncbi:leucyl aminopeptidase [Bowdeniella nasicola]|uniref:Probable cytosol aminopeptidase n=1 Tax=Bowdeniella nasicola TaxID=208480 RepID=A0A1Q5Q319_9ACTO|nr:leucyl aminopeptidase [Bowdeniella nasicola]OKL54233.1 leucyl aminopeptidase [Bowdeniella nasicola]
MNTVELHAKKLSAIKADVLLVGATKVDDEVVPFGGPAITSKADHALANLISQLDISCTEGCVTKVMSDQFATPVAIVGVGENPSPEALRRAVGSAVRNLAGFAHVAICLPTSGAEEVGAIAEGAVLGSYAFAQYKKCEKDPVEKVTIVTPIAGEKDVKAAAQRGAILATGVNRARDLVNMAPNDLVPETFADYATQAAKGLKVKVTILDEKKLAAGGYGGIIAVGMGSDNPPRLVQLEYSPAKATGHVSLVGKGITFDSGGLSLKPGKGMETMKCDMGGAAAVLNAVLVAAELKLPVKVTGWLALAENMPSGGAQRPGDIISMYDDTTVEVLNTDAEGRLVMADALARAIEDKPDALLDIATLTGAAVVALGERTAGVMGDEQLRSDIVAAADAAGEAFWPMPLPNELKEGLKSPVADLQNIGDRWGGMLSAGLFLQHFVKDTPWAHLDIAGPAFHEKAPYGYTPKGGTGFGVRTLVGLLENFEK